MSDLAPPLSAPNLRIPKRVSVLLMIAILGLVAVLIVPLPTVVMDLLICVNFTGSILILLATLGASRPLDFSTFPSVILMTALLRLALNVASTKLILLQGDAGAVIQAFGQFVIGGSYVVGIVIFLILIVIQFVVITKGQNRIAEVTARFALDAMPGKQMAIDADLNAGVISNEEAKTRRAEVQAESEFYGAMDGAGKFIRGDAVAGLIITAINIVGGICIGVLTRGMQVEQALGSYTVLTIGDGLVSQIPGLIVSIASGILVTKAATKKDLAHEMVGQVMGRSKTVLTAGVTLCALALLPGMPMLPFLSLAVAMFFLSTRRDDGSGAESEGPVDADVDIENEERRIEELLQVDRLGIEIGYRLISIVDPGRHGGLLDHVAALRRQFASNLGIVVSPIRIKDNIQIDPNEYRILLMGNEVAKGEIRAGQFLAMDPTRSAEPIDGVETVEPAFGLPAKWIAEGEKEQAEILGYTVIDAPSVLVTHLSEVIRRIAHEILSREDVQALLDHTKKSNPTVVSELVPSVLSISQVQRVLAGLLKERVSIRNLGLILEALGDAAQDSKDVRHLVEAVRLRLARSIAETYADPDGKLHVVTIRPELENRLLAAITGTGLQTGQDDGVLAEGMLGEFVERVATVLAELVRQGHAPVVLTRAGLRPFLAEAIVGAVPGSAVLSYQEAAPASDVQVLGQVELEGAAA